MFLKSLKFLQVPVAEEPSILGLDNHSLQYCPDAIRGPSRCQELLTTRAIKELASPLDLGRQSFQHEKELALGTFYRGLDRPARAAQDMEEIVLAFGAPVTNQVSLHFLYEELLARAPLALPARHQVTRHWAHIFFNPPLAGSNFGESL